MKKRSMIPRDFIVTAAMRKLAEQNHWPNPDEEVAAFIDHHRAKGSLFLDHQAAFRTWLRNAARWRGNGNSKAEPKGFATIGEFLSSQRKR
jgi:hypothetical protein